MKYNFTEFEDLFNKLRSCIEYYEKNHLGNKSFKLFLSNGEKIIYTIQPCNLPHLLGIKNILELKKFLNIRTDDIIEILKEICDKSYTLYKKINEGSISMDMYFSKFIDRKIENFKGNFYPFAESMINETEFVCQYKSERSWVHTVDSKKYNYIVVKRLYNGKISILGLVKNEGRYYAMSNQLFNNLEEANDTLELYIKNQTITLLTGVNIYNFYTDGAYNKSLSIDQKLGKIESLMKYQKYDCTIALCDDYIYLLNLLISMKTEQAINSAPNKEKTYTEMIKELNEAKELIIGLTKKVTNLENENSTLSGENTTLKKQNEQYEANEQAIMKILKRPEN